ncbi:MULTISPECIES: 3-hydroxyisobutyrate dehydrogenase [unclassified Caballeronia]|uniref:3-hydroxyisobutyrate dehydrogenase n=1 Tax=unclassified Caballeronia TaxID=2646786 RepID=UPI00285D8810|nr:MULTISPECIES: 3-hydroxyisobutyrate dehydrogenase [unclassified Caballeronia]MDR5817819.1 3-hydroxyisobutyrate dehydrogenase [Caballeronia sp. LZ033]MDR5882657.1 3-hydroxyisobutyrate dehydrogenase [Caballeronia sp. LZ032]
MKIGFIGLGHMGGPMVANLLKAGHALTAFDLVPAALDAARSAGATLADSPRAAAEGAEVVITMLPAAQHVKAVYLNDDGVLAGVAKGVPLVDSSTIDPATAKLIGEASAQHGNPFADAPVSGGVVGAQAGTLTFMVGADEALFDTLRPVLSGMGKNMVRCGETGTGQIAKICNNLLLAISMIGVAEAMKLGETLGIDPSKLASIVNTSTGRCWSSDTCNPYPGIVETAPASRGYAGGFGADLMLKDLGLAVDAARGAKQPVFMGALAQQLYQSMSQQGLGGLDFSGIIKLYGKN